MFEPCFEIPTKRSKPFDSALCLVCQKKVENPKRGKPPVRDKSSFEVFVDVCKWFSENGDIVSHRNLQEAIRGKTADQLRAEEFCFHTKCRSEIQKIDANRRRSVEEKNEKVRKSQSPSAQDSKVKRSETACFNKFLCLFCQNNLTDEQLLSVRQTSRDQELKEAFLECPRSLALFKIRSSHAYDAMAGDITYHHSCWRTHITNRNPEIQIEHTPNRKSISKPVQCSEELVDEEDAIFDTQCADSVQSPQVRTVNLRNGRALLMNDDIIDDSPESSLKRVVYSEMMEGLKIELIEGNAITLNNLVEVYKSRMEEHGMKDPRTDKAIRIETQRWVTKDVCGMMDEVVLERSYERNVCNRVMTKDAKAFAIKVAEESASATDDEEIAVLKQASMILRRRTLKFMQKNPSKSENLKISSQHNDQFPPELLSFVNGLIFGQRNLNSVESSERKVLSATIASSIMHNMKTDRQVKYVAKRKTQGRHTYLPHQCIALALSIRHCERNNAILRLLSAPNFGMIIPPRIALLYETMIANAVTKIAEKDGVYIPPNMERGVRVSFHIDNFDEQVLSFDGKNTVHYLLIVGFQRQQRGLKPIELTLEKTSSLTLKDNSFGELLPCEEPSNRQFSRSNGCVDVTCSTGYEACRSATIPVWKCLRSFEHLLVKDETATYVSSRLSDKIAAPASESDQPAPSWNLDSLILPSLSATNSMVVSMDQTLTSIFPLPFVAGPASSTSAVFTALEIAHKTSAVTSLNNQNAADPVEEPRVQNSDEEITREDFLTRSLDPPPSWKTIIVLDLDLYSKAYKLVHSRPDLRNKYVLCLGELHIVFASIRAIGTFIDSSGIDDAWIGAHWFDSESLLRQVKECSNMKRAIATHEATYIAIQTMIIQETLRWYGIENLDGSDLYQIIESARNCIKENKTEPEKFKEVWCRMKSKLDALDLELKIKKFIDFHKHNCLLQFLVKYCDMVTRLLTFIEATRSRNWLLHLDALEDMLPDFASMDRINYRRLTAVYIADMKHLQTNDVETWNYFAEGNFCCQKNNIPYTAIGRDHCGEQQNKVLKGRGGVSGQSSNSNSTIRYFMTAPVLSQIYSEMVNAGGYDSGNSKQHHQLNNSYTSKQNEWVVSLLRLFEKQNVSLSTNEKDTAFYNIMTGQIFSQAIYDDLIGAYNKGVKLVKMFAAERLKPNSKVGIFAPLKKAKVKNCKSANKGAEVKYKDKFATLKEENLFVSRIAMIRGSREVDMKSHIGQYELTSVVHSLMKRDGTLLDGWDGKSNLAARVLAEANIHVTPSVTNKSQCVAIDAMYVMNQISTKPIWIKTGRDLAAEFCKRVDQQTEGAEIVVIGFEWYSNESLKASAWQSRQNESKGKRKVKRGDYNLEPDTDLTKRCMKDILGTIPTKKSLTTLLMNAMVDHLKERDVEFFISGNGLTFSSCSGEGTTNHKEGETAIVMGLSSLKLKDKRVMVYGSDVDLFVLLLSHYSNIDCLEIQMKSLAGYTSITDVYNFLGNDVASALLPFHAITGCDVTGKFSGKSKDFWAGKFLEERSNEEFIDSLLKLQNLEIESVQPQLAQFICRSYCPTKTPRKITDSLVETRYFLYKKFRSETNKLPPSPGAFTQHLKRACCPLVIWSSSNMTITDSVDPLQYGWELKEDTMMPVCSRDDIAPEELIDLVSCNCNGDCSKGRCTCKKNKVACTDFCGCGDECMNTDVSPPALNADDNEESEAEIAEFLQAVDKDLECNI